MICIALNQWNQRKKWIGFSLKFNTSFCFWRTEILFIGSSVLRHSWNWNLIESKTFNTSNEHFTTTYRKISLLYFFSRVFNLIGTFKLDENFFNDSHRQFWTCQYNNKMLFIFLENLKRYHTHFPRIYRAMWL